MAAPIIPEFLGYYAVQSCPTCNQEQGRFDPRGGQAGTTAAFLKRQHQAVSLACDIVPRKAAPIVIYDAGTHRLVGKTSTAARFGDVYRDILEPDARAHYGLELRRAGSPRAPLAVVATPTAEEAKMLWQDEQGQWWAKLTALEASPFQPLDRAKSSLQPLADSLEQQGQLHPIDLRVMTPMQFRVMDGHRRVEVARDLGWDRVKAAPHRNIQTDEQELLFIQTVNTERLAYGGKEVLQAMKVSGWDFERFQQASSPKMQKALGRWLLRFPGDVAEAERMMHIFGTPNAIYAATILVRYVHGAEVYRSHRTEARQEQWALEAKMLRWMSLSGGKGLGMMQRTALLGMPTVAQIRRAMKKDQSYLSLLPKAK